MCTESLSGIKGPGRGGEHPPLLAPRLRYFLRYTSASTLCLQGSGMGVTVIFIYSEKAICVDSKVKKLIKIKEDIRW